VKGRSPGTLGADGRTVSKCILEQKLTGLNWLRIECCGGILFWGSIKAGNFLIR
jgi:hypothetical protein